MSDSFCHLSAVPAAQERKDNGRGSRENSDGKTRERGVTGGEANVSDE